MRRGRLRLDLPELREVVKQRLGAVDAGVGGGCAEALYHLFDRLAVHDVLRFGEVAEHVEGLQPCELFEQIFALGVRRVALGALGFDGLDDAVDQALVGLEVADPSDELLLEALGQHDRLAARVAVTTGRAHVALRGVAAAGRAMRAPQRSQRSNLRRRYCSEGGPALLNPRPARLVNGTQKRIYPSRRLERTI